MRSILDRTYRHPSILRSAKVRSSLQFWKCRSEETPEIDDQHLRGGKFDWEAFMTGDYSKLLSAAAEKSGVGRKRQEAKEESERNNPSPVRIGECIKDWASESPGIGVVYDLFCDMVHPNIGSTFLVGSVAPNGLYFTKYRGKSVIRHALQHSFPLCAPTT